MPSYCTKRRKFRNTHSQTPKSRFSHLPPDCNNILFPTPPLQADQHLRNFAFAIVVSPLFSTNHTYSGMSRWWWVRCRQRMKCQSVIPLGCADNSLSLLLFTQFREKEASKATKKRRRKSIQWCRRYTLTHTYKHIPDWNIYILTRINTHPWGWVVEEITYFLSIWIQSNPSQSKSIHSIPTFGFAFYSLSRVRFLSKTGIPLQQMPDSFQFDSNATRLNSLRPAYVMFCYFDLLLFIVVLFFSKLLSCFVSLSYFVIHIRAITHAYTTAVECHTCHATHTHSQCMCAHTHIVVPSIRMWRSWHWAPPRAFPIHLVAPSRNPGSLVNQWTHLICLSGNQLRQPPIVAFYFVPIVAFLLLLLHSHTRAHYIAFLLLLLPFILLLLWRIQIFFFEFLCLQMSLYILYTYINMHRCAYINVCIISNLRIYLHNAGGVIRKSLKVPKLLKF